MTSAEAEIAAEPPSEENVLVSFGWVAFALALTLPWMVLRLVGNHLDVVPVVLLSGFSIVGAAFILSWAGEASQLEISPSLAVVFLALVAVLPEYAVDMYYAWGAGVAMRSWVPGAERPLEFGLPMANMTGSNRLLIGLGWAMVALIYCWKTKRSALILERTVSLEFSFLVVATLYSFKLPLLGTISVWDGLVYFLLFLQYIRKASKASVQDTMLEGPAALLGRLPRLQRCMANIFFFLLAGCAIALAAEPFAEGLKQIGARFHIEPFLLVQWLAPLASESPEFIVAALFALRNNASLAMGALISSKVNQWTLLVGMIPLAFAVSSHGALVLPLDLRQREELLLTASQSAFALAVIGNLAITRVEAWILALLFVAQMFFPTTPMRLAFSALYGVGMVVVFARQDWRSICAMVRRNVLG